MTLVMTTTVNPQPVECIICTENAELVSCDQCTFQFCKDCKQQMGKCPQCRFIYDSDTETRIRNEINEEYDDDDDYEYIWYYILFICYFAVVFIVPAVNVDSGRYRLVNNIRYKK